VAEITRTEDARRERRRSTSSQVAAYYIRQLILEGRLLPGQRVTQDEVASALGLSHMPVREAIVALEREGFVTTELNRGAFVRLIDEQTVRDQYEMYGMFYGYAAERALERSDAEFIERLREIEDLLSSTDDPARIGELSLGFNRIVVTEAKSRRILLVIKALPAIRAAVFFTVVPDAIGVTKRGVKAVLHALERGDAPAVIASYAEMMQGIGEHAVELFRARGLFTPPVKTTE
jgi:DNA-binding GntR family transcriptional regulator